MTGTITIRELASLTDTQRRQLAEVLCDCVEGGASVNFMLPFPPEQAEAFWRRIEDAVAKGERALLVAQDEGGTIHGTVQLVLDTPPNQPHRADIAKMLVHRRARRLGLGAQLMQAAERLALKKGRSLLTLDTASDDAERLYTRMGWQRFGVVPDYACLPQGGLCAATFFYKQLVA